jgi:signal transduction histidine kinase
MFRDKAIFLLVISAFIIPLIFFSSDLITTGSLVLLFILAQLFMLYLFYKAQEPAVEHWYAFWTAILSLGFMLALVVLGKTMLTEFLGLMLFLVYFIGLILFLFKERLALAAKKLGELRKPGKKKADENEIEEKEVDTFRKKDQLQELVDFFEAEEKPGARIVELEEPKIEKIIIEKSDEELEEEARKKEQTTFASEEWGELPKSIIFEYPETEEKKPELLYEEKPKVKELKEAPKVDFEKVKQDLDKIDRGVKTISEKIKEISEKAIAEEEERKRIAEAVRKMPKPKKKELRVFASKTGNKFHYKRGCLGLRRVGKKNIITYPNSEEARKKKLKACGMCR